MMNIRKIWDRILATPFFRNIFKLSVSSIIVMGVSIIMTPILSRVFDPECYGEWGVFSSVAMIIGSFIFLSYENAIVKTNEKDEVPKVVSLCLLIAFLIIVLTTAVFFIGKYAGIAFFKTYPSITLLCILLIATTLNTLFTNISNRYSLYTIMSVAGIIAGITQAISRLVFGLLHFELGLIYGNVLSVIISVSYFYFKTRGVLKDEIFKKVQLSDVLIVADKYKRFPLYDAPARLIEFVIGNIVILILSFHFDLKEIGCFSMIATLVQMPLTLMGSSMSTVYFKDLSVISQEKEEVTKLTRRTVHICFLMSFLPCAFLVLGGDYILVLFLGDKWQLVGSMSLCLAIFSIPVILSEPLIPIFKVLNRQDIRFWLNVANLISIITAIYVGIYLSHNILITLILYSIAYATLRFIMFGYQLRLARVSIRDCGRDFLIVAILYIALCVRLIFII